VTGARYPHAGVEMDNSGNSTVVDPSSIFTNDVSTSEIALTVLDGVSELLTNSTDVKKTTKEILSVRKH